MFTSNFLEKLILWEDFGLTQEKSYKIIEEVKKSVRDWRKIAQSFGIKESEMKRMESAFEHKDLSKTF